MRRTAPQDLNAVEMRPASGFGNTQGALLLLNAFPRPLIPVQPSDQVLLLEATLKPKSNGCNKHIPVILLFIRVIN